jgi:hypothetical protein
MTQPPPGWTLRMFAGSGFGAIRIRVFSVASMAAPVLQ